MNKFYPSYNLTLKKKVLFLVPFLFCLNIKLS